MVGQVYAVARSQSCAPAAAETDGRAQLQLDGFPAGVRGGLQASDVSFGSRGTARAPRKAELVPGRRASCSISSPGAAASDTSGRARGSARLRPHAVSPGVSRHWAAASQRSGAPMRVPGARAGCAGTSRRDGGAKGFLLLTLRQEGTTPASFRDLSGG